MFFDDSFTLGKVGLVYMRQLWQRDPLKELRLDSEDIQQAAEVVLGRLDIRELIGGTSRDKAAKVSYPVISLTEALSVRVSQRV